MKKVLKHNPEKDAAKCCVLIHLSSLGAVKTQVQLYSFCEPQITAFSAVKPDL